MTRQVSTASIELQDTFKGTVRAIAEMQKVFNYLVHAIPEDSKVIGSLPKSASVDTVVLGHLRRAVGLQLNKLDGIQVTGRSLEAELKAERKKLVMKLLNLSDNISHRLNMKSSREVSICMESPHPTKERSFGEAEVEEEPAVLVEKEEEEEMYSSQQCTLYLFMDRGFNQAAKWVVRGNGIVRFFKHNSRQTVRISLHQHQRGSLRLNHLPLPETEITSHEGKDTVWKWSATDYSDDIYGQLQTFAVRFAQSQHAKEFLQHFNKAKQCNKKAFSPSSPSPSPSPSLAPLPSGLKFVPKKPQAVLRSIFDARFEARQLQTKMYTLSETSTNTELGFMEGKAKALLTRVDTEETFKLMEKKEDLGEWYDRVNREKKALVRHLLELLDEIERRIKARKEKIPRRK